MFLPNRVLKGEHIYLALQFARWGERLWQSHPGRWGFPRCSPSSGWKCGLPASQTCCSERWRRLQCRSGTPGSGSSRWKMPQTPRRWHSCRCRPTLWSSGHALQTRHSRHLHGTNTRGWGPLGDELTSWWLNILGRRCWESLGLENTYREFHVYESIQRQECFQNPLLKTF